MDYREFPAPSALAGHIECLWRLTQARPTGAPQTIYPDGRSELIVHLASPPRCWDTVRGWHVQARTLFAAQRVVAVRLEATGPLDCIGVRLRPAVSNALLRGAGTRHRDQVVDLASLDAGLSRALVRAGCQFARGHAKTLWALLAKRCHAVPVDARVSAAIERLEREGGRSRIEPLARAAALSMRGFQVRFRAAVGLTPKEFARLARLQSTLRALDASDTRISDLASDGGFADQAHATRELRRVTGHTPARLRQELRRDRDGDAAVRLAAAFVRGYAT
ncbi:MAG TPA: AraC family transcriptional regulator [Steroidobacteraceae bacterium]